MKLFKPKYSVCAECGVHFDIVPPSEERWGHLCPTHRKPVMDLDLRKDALMRFILQNFELVEKLCAAERDKQYAADMKQRNAYMDSLAGMQQAQPDPYATMQQAAQGQFNPYSPASPWGFP